MKKLMYLVVTALMLVSCGPTRVDMEKKIKQDEDKLFADQNKGIEKDKASALIDSYIAFADAFPGDTMAPDYLFRAADISMNIFKSEEAINLYNRIINDYPDYKKMPQCIFLKAFVYENNLKDLNSAKKYYTEFLEKYPNDEFADDAEMSLKNLGKTPEELIKEFESKMDKPADTLQK